MSYQEQSAQRHMEYQEEFCEETNGEDSYWTDEEMEEYKEQMRRLKQPKTDWLERLRDWVQKKFENALT